MTNLNEDIIRSNIFKLAEYSGISEINLSLILDISVRQLERIKNGDGSFSIKSINKACSFFNYDIKELNVKKNIVAHEFRERLKEIHKSNIEYYKVLSDRPSITYVIKFILVENSVFLSKGLPVRDIRKFLLERGYTFSSAHISLGLSRLKSIDRKSNPDKKNTFIYKLN